MEEKVNFANKEWLQVELDDYLKEQEELEYMKHALRMIDESVNGKEFPEFEYDDPVESVRKVLQELKDEVGEI